MTRIPGRARLAGAALLCGGSLASAQGWQSGAKAGISSGRYTGSQEFVWQTAVPTTSIFVRRSLTSRLTAQSELGLVRRVGISTQPGSTLRLTADYVELPILLQLHSPNLWTLQPFVSLGPSLSYRIRCSLVFQGGGFSSAGDCDASTGAQTHRFDVGASGGLGANWHIGSTMLQIESRVTAGSRTNVLPIDVTSRAVQWTATAGVAGPLTMRPSKPKPREPGAPVIASRDRLRDENIAAMVLAYATSDISYARLVPRRGVRPDVKQFAQRMLQEHANVFRSVRDVVAKLDIGIEDNAQSLHMRDESNEQRETMYFVEGRRFDSTYVESEVRFHREFLSLVDDVLIDRARSPEMRALVAKLRPTVADRLASAEQLRRQVLPAPLVAVARTTATPTTRKTGLK